jgi:hypothetical protein
MISQINYNDSITATRKAIRAAGYHQYCENTFADPFYCHSGGAAVS